MERPSDPGLDQVPPAELRARLHRAEETLRAIRSGEVDAFIVAGERGPRVVMLEGTAHPYIALMERINEGAVTLSADGEILYCNLFLARLLDMAREQLIGSAFRDLVVPEDRADYDGLLVSGGSGGSHGGLSLCATDGSYRQVLLSLNPTAPVLNGGHATERTSTGLIGIVTDLNNLRAAEQRLQAGVRQQSEIAWLGQRALAGISLDEVLKDATQLVARTLGAAQCAVVETLSEGERFRVRAAAFPAGLRPDEIIPAAEAPLSALTLRAGRPVIVDDVATDQRFAGAPGPLLRGNLSAIAVIVPDEGSPFGVLAAASPDRQRFSEGDSDFLQSVANVLAAAIMRRRSEDLRRWLLQELTRSRDDERRRLSRELHDETRQSLWALVVGLNALETVPQLEHAREAAQRLHAIATRTLDDIGRLARGLHPGALDDHGLVAAATQYLSDFTSSYGIPVEQGVEDQLERLPPEVEITLYRILQEALTNVARHARARSVRATLRRIDAGVELIVVDDGVGFRVEPVRSPRRPGGLGLHGMRERASMLGGELTVASRPGAGTTVTARIPLAASPVQ